MCLYQKGNDHTHPNAFHVLHGSFPSSFRLVRRRPVVRQWGAVRLSKLLLQRSHSTALGRRLCRGSGQLLGDGGELLLKGRSCFLFLHQFGLQWMSRLSNAYSASRRHSQT